MNTPDFDHTSFAVRDATAWGRRLRRDLGATPIAGEVLPDFRYLLMHVGGHHDGGRLEVIQPAGTGFLARFMARHGEGPHHITFTVPDLAGAVRDARALGAEVVGEDYAHEPWREAFLMPDGNHAVVIQLAQSDRRFPSTAELLASRVRDVASYPSNRGASEPHWWWSVWEEQSLGHAVLGATHLNSTNLKFSRRLFEGVLGATVREHERCLDLTWPGGVIRVHQGDRAGVTGVDLAGGPDGGLTIGTTTLGESHDATHEQ